MLGPIKNTFFFSLIVSTKSTFYGILLFIFPGNFKNVTIGYGNNAWALDSKGNIHKKDSLNNIHMMGKDWKNQYFNLNIREIAAGLTGVYALARDGSFGRVKGNFCLLLL